jgi:peptidoglycan/LPS O-acetylase OafA/YrhL
MIGMISNILINPKSLLLSNILGNHALVLLGKISYGVYLFHNFVPTLLNGLLHLLKKRNIEILSMTYNSQLNEQSILFYFISFLILLLISLTSFYFFESKIQKFKIYFT